jgi:hypothetical protein
VGGAGVTCETPISRDPDLRTVQQLPKLIRCSKYGAKQRQAAERV